MQLNADEYIYIYIYIYIYTHTHTHFKTYQLTALKQWTTWKYWTTWKWKILWLQIDLTNLDQIEFEVSATILVNFDCKVEYHWTRSLEVLLLWVYHLVFSVSNIWKKCIYIKIGHVHSVYVTVYSRVVITIIITKV